MQKLLNLILLMLCIIPVNAQHLLEVEGMVKVTDMDTTSQSDSLVVRLPDGTLAVRDVSTIQEYQILHISNDTIFLSNGGFAVLPEDNNAGWNMNSDSVWTLKKSVGIGTANPEGNLEIAELINNGTPARVKITGNGQKDADGAVELILDGRRGSILNDAGIVEFKINGNKGASVSSRVGKSSSVVDGANLVFSTAMDSASLHERMRISNQGRVGVGTTEPMEKLHVDGKVKVDTMQKINSADSIVVWLPDHTLGIRDASSLDELPSNPSSGDLAYFDGTEWKSLAPGSNNEVLRIENGKPTWSEPCGQLSLWQFYKGGYIFYLDSTKCHGLVAAPYDLYQDWGCYNNTIGSTSNLLGTGQANTDSILAGCNEADFAAKACDDFSYAGYSDWYLPSKQELALMWLVLADRDGNGINGGYDDPNNVGGFFAHSTAGIYWTSTEHSATHAWYQSFYDATQQIRLKNSVAYIRPIRAF